MAIVDGDGKERCPTERHWYASRLEDGVESQSIKLINRSRVFPVVLP